MPWAINGNDNQDHTLTIVATPITLTLEHVFPNKLRIYTTLNSQTAFSVLHLAGILDGQRQQGSLK